MGVKGVESLEKIAKPRSRNLLFTSAGDASNVRLWCKGRKNFDLWVVYYGDRPGRYAGLSDHYLMRKGGKFPNFQYVYKKWESLFKEYDAVMIMDDDIIIDATGINDLFNIRDRYDLWVCQPAFLPSGRISHSITCAQNGNLLRYTNFVEVACPLFKREKLDDFMTVYDPVLVGYGVDWWFLETLGANLEGRVAIVDAVTCTNPHTLSKGSARQIDILQDQDARKKIWAGIKERLNITSEDRGYREFGPRRLTLGDYWYFKIFRKSWPGYPLRNRMLWVRNTLADGAACFTDLDKWFILLVLASVAGVLYLTNIFQMSREGSVILLLCLLGGAFFISFQTLLYRRIEAQISALRKIVQDQSWATRNSIDRLAGKSDLFSQKLYEQILHVDDKSSIDNVAVIIGIRNRNDHRLEKCLQSLRAQDYRRDLVDILVVDYGGDPERIHGLSMLCQQYGARYIRVDGALVWNKAKCLNIGIRQAQAKYMLFSDMDMIFERNYISSCITQLKSDPFSIAYCPALNATEDSVGPETDVLEDYLMIKANAVYRSESYVGSTYRFGLGVCFLMTEFVYWIRGWDERYVGWGFEDDDFIKRLEMVGLNLVSLEGRTSHIHQAHPEHEKVASQESGSMERNRKYFLSTHTIVRNTEKWGLLES